MMATPRLLLKPATAETLGLAMEDRREDLGRALDAQLASDWPPSYDENCRVARENVQRAQEILLRDPSQAGWWGWWVILQQPRPVLIGSVTTQGPPDEEGTVEIAYGIVGSLRGHGYATEATKALVDWVCRDSRTRRIVAETQPLEGESIAVMEKVGLSFLGEGAEPGAIRYGRVCPD